MRHQVGNAGAAEDGPDRLSVADQELRTRVAQVGAPTSDLADDQMLDAAKAAAHSLLAIAQEVSAARGLLLGDDVERAS